MKALGYVIGWRRVDGRYRVGSDVAGEPRDMDAYEFPQQARAAAMLTPSADACAVVPLAALDAVPILALADIVKVIDAERSSEDESAKYGADLLAAIIRDALRRHGLYPEVQR